MMSYYVMQQMTRWQGSIWLGWRHLFSFWHVARHFDFLNALILLDKTENTGLLMS